MIYTPSCIMTIKRIAVLLLMVICITGCSDGAQYTWSNAGGLPVETPPVVQKEIRLKVFMPEQSGVWNPLINRSREMSSLMTLVYEGLLRFDAEMKPVPCLAESWTPEEDGAVLLTLRKDITFSDGKPLTAYDVEATLSAIKDAGEQGTYGYILPYIKRWEVVSERELRVRGSVAEPMLVYAFTFPVLPAGDTRLGDLPGTGPMRVIQYSEGYKLEMERNPLWWREEPAVAGITAIALTDDVAAVNAFAMQRLDMLSTRRPNATQTLSPDSFRSYVESTRQFDFLALNLRNPELADVRMRAAIRMAIDRKDIADSVFLGHAVVADIPVLPNSALKDQRFTTMDYAPEEAAALLKSMGFHYDELSGALMRSGASSGEYLDNDAEVIYTLVYNEALDNTYRREMAARIAASLKKIGIGLELKELKYTDYEKALMEGDYDIALTGYEISPIPDLTFCYGTHAQGTNITYYGSEEMDALLTDARAAEDMDALRRAISGIETLVAADMPFIGLFFRTGTLLTRPELEGISKVREDSVYLGIGDWISVH